MTIGTGAGTEFALFIDDDPQADRDARRISESGLRCKRLPPDSTIDALAKTILEEGPSILLLDYRLDDLSDADYRAGTVAAWTREKLASIPVVLVTTQENLKDWVAGSPQVRQLFDLEIFKSEIAKAGRDEPTIATQLLDLISGYHDIGTALSQDDPQQAVIRLLRPASEGEIRAIMDCGPPAGEHLQPSTIASWLLRKVLKHPGPLLDINESAVRLGILEDGLTSREVQESLPDCAYSGVFSASHPRWWRGRLETKLRADLLPEDAEFDARTSSEALSKATNVNLEHAVCSWCLEPYPIRICTTCGKPVDLSHSLVVEAPERPGWAEPSLACFTCIADGRAEDERFVAGGEDIVASLKRGEIRKPEDHD